MFSPPGHRNVQNHFTDLRITLTQLHLIHCFLLSILMILFLPVNVIFCSEDWPNILSISHSLLSQFIQSYRWRQHQQGSAPTGVTPSQTLLLQASCSPSACNSPKMTWKSLPYDHHTIFIKGASDTPHRLILTNKGQHPPHILPQVILRCRCCIFWKRILELWWNPEIFTLFVWAGDFSLCYYLKAEYLGAFWSIEQV